MKKIKSTSLTILLAISTISAAKDMAGLMNMGINDQFSFDDVFNNAQAQIERVEAELKHALNAMPKNSASPTIILAKNNAPTIKEDDTYVYISLKLTSIDDDKMVMKKVEDSKGEHLVVQVPDKDHTVEMVISTETLSVSSQHKATEEKINDEEHAALATFGVSRMIQSLPAKVLLQEPKAEYDEEKEILTITLKKAETIKTEIIPIKKK